MKKIKKIKKLNNIVTAHIKMYGNGQKNNRYYKQGRPNSSKPKNRNLSLGDPSHNNSSKKLNKYGNPEYCFQNKGKFISPPIPPDSLPNVNQRNLSVYGRSNGMNEDPLNEEISLLQNLWDDLGVTNAYQEQFLNYMGLINENEQKDLLSCEKKNLKRFRDALIMLSKEVASREKNRQILIKYNEIAENAYNEDHNITDTLLKNIINIMKTLILNSINAVNQFINLREISSHYSKKKIWDLNNLNQSYLYDPRYLTRIKNDMKFLQNSPLNDFIDLNYNDLDTFLVDKNSYDKKNEYKSNKTKIPISDDLLKAINQCRYVILQETMLNNINNLLKQKNSKMKKDSEKIFKLKQKSGSNIVIMRDNDPLPYNNNTYSNQTTPRNIGNGRESTNYFIGNMSQHLNKLKNEMGNEYDKLFLKRQLNLPSRDINNKGKYYQRNIIRDDGNMINNTPIKIEIDEDPYMSKEKFLADIEELEQSTNEINKQKTNVSIYIEKQKEEERKRLEEENKKLEKQKEEIKKNLKGEIEKLEKKNNESLKEIKQLKEEKREREEDLKNEKAKRRQFEYKNEELEKKLEDEKKKFKELKEEKRIQEEEEKRKIEEEKRKLEEEKIKLEEEKRKTEEDKGKVEQKNRKIEEDKGKIEEEKRKIEEDKGKIEEDKRKIEVEKGKLEEDKRKIEEGKRKLEEDKGKVEEENRKLEENKGKVEEDKRKIEEDKGKIEEEKREIEENKGKVEEDKRKIEEEKGKIEEEKRKIEEEKRKIEEDKRKIEEDKRKIEEEEKRKIEEDKRKIEENIIEDPPKTYEASFYNENLDQLLDKLSEIFKIESISAPVKAAFNLTDSIYSKDFFLRGIYPKIITSSYDSKITGFCLVYYENYSIKDLKLVLDCICLVEENWEEQLVKLVDFITKKLEYDELLCQLYYEKNSEGKKVLNPIIKDLFKTKLKFNWKNVENRKGKLIQKIGYKKPDDDKKLENRENYLFNLRTLSLMSINSQLIDEKTQKIIKNAQKSSVNKFINLAPLYILLNNITDLKINFTNNKRKLDSDNLMKDLKEIVKINTNLNDFTSLQTDNDIFDIEESISKEVTDIYNQNNITLSYNSCNLNVNLDFDSICCLKFEKYFYNQIRLSSIRLLKDESTKTYFYLIPTKEAENFILICEVNDELREKLLDNKKCIFEKFIEMYPVFISNFKKFSLRIGLEESTYEQREKTIYIPAFSIDSHLYSYNIPELDKNVEINDEKSGIQGKISSVDEYLKINLCKDNNIDNGFTLIPIEGNRENVVIRQPFLFGVSNREAMKSNLPFLQLLYVTKENWIKAE